MIRLTCHEKPPVDTPDEHLMFRIVRAAFNQRRKTLVNAINNSPELSMDKVQVQEALAAMGLSATVRGEALSLDQFAKLSELLAG